ncbi:hypothetical protein BV22DRAFT_199383 [Leucogyrophana mollusca]|uniref:Uncharacterized protein n=1 Tax=Leucogyrophana mollusca TaxID=85980 RepID=A0ACB8BT98_9AGAM|nr:hypothetical protein BV22DRAFT_199383 [Leucogyrophana mollusca]
MPDMDSSISKLSESKYAVRRKELLGLVKQLRAVGAQTDLDLPRIAVIGNQSAGKSSVVEAISGITVPRDAGTCTRCPMECRMSSSERPWSCQISIRWEYDELGNLLKDVSEVPFGNIIKDKADVELTLRCAQAAVLNPSVSATQFQGMKAEELKRFKGKPLPFSRNVVCVDLEGPDLTDLSFIDLPGIIQNAEPDIVNLVEDLVVSHIKGNTIILVALPMTDDIENQKALRLARQIDGDGHRTIGVLTKPDMLGSGSTKARELWMDVIEGRRHILTHGYYCTRQPDDADRTEGISTAQARIQESTFFRTTPPWSGSTQTHRFGTSNLVNALSAQLVQMINDMLPNIRSDAAQLLAACQSKLSSIPKAIEADPASHMMNLVADFCATIDRYVRGGADASILIQGNRTSFTAFKHVIRSSAPNFIPYRKAGDNQSAFQNHLGDGTDEGPEEGLNSLQKPLYLQDMRELIERSRTRELPGNIPFPAKVTLIDAFQVTWESAASECSEQIRKSLLSLLLNCVKDQFERYGNLKAHLQILIPELVSLHYDRCIVRIQEQLEMERTPFTQNTHYLETCTEKWMKKYKEERAGKIVAPLESSAKRQKVTANSLQSTPAPPAQDIWGDFEDTWGTFTQPNQNMSSVSGAPPTPPAFGLSAQPKNGFSGSKPAPKASQASKSTTSQKQKDGSTLCNPAIISPTSVNAVPRPQTASSTTNVTGRTPDPGAVEEVLAGLNKLGYHGITYEDLARLLPPDEYETELRVMAEVRGYFQVAYKRVIDTIPSLLDLLFVKAVGKALQSYLITKLGIGTANSSERLAMYVAEDPHVVSLREELIAKKKRLEVVEVELRNFGL